MQANVEVRFRWSIHAARARLDGASLSGAVRWQVSASDSRRWPPPRPRRFRPRPRFAVTPHWDDGSRRPGRSRKGAPDGCDEPRGRRGSVEIVPWWLVGADRGRDLLRLRHYGSVPFLLSTRDVSTRGGSTLRTTAYRHSLMVRTGIRRAAHQQRRSLQRAQFDRCVQDFALGVAGSSDQPLHRPLSGSQSQRPRAIRQGAKPGPITGRGQADRRCPRGGRQS